MVWGSHMTFGVIKCTLEHHQKWWFGSNGVSFSMVVIYVSKTSLGKPIHFSGAFLAVSFRVITPISVEILWRPLHIFSFFWGEKALQQIWLWVAVSSYIFWNLYFGEDEAIPPFWRTSYLFNWGGEKPPTVDEVLTWKSVRFAWVLPHFHAPGEGAGQKMFWQIVGSVGLGDDLSLFCMI